MLHAELHPVSETIGRNAIVIILTGDSPSGLKGKTWPPLIAALNARGIAVFAFDFLSQGRSDGERTSLSLSVGCENFVDGYRTLGEHLDLSSYRIGLLGSSFGGAVVLSAHGQIARYEAIALKSPASFLAESYETEHGFPDGMDAWRRSGVSEKSGLHYSAYLDAVVHNAYQSALEIRVPVLIVHGGADSIVPVVQSRRLCHLFYETARLIELPGVNHDYKQPGAQETMQNHVTQFFEAVLLA